MSPGSLPFPKPAFDLTRTYVRFRRLRDNGFVEFDFAIGDPELSVTLTLDLADYRNFCRTAQVTYLTREQERSVDAERSKWRYGVPGLQES